MRSREFVDEARKKKPVEPKAGDTTPHDYNPGWEGLNWLKETAMKNGERMAGSYQLFVPRPNPAATTQRDRRLKNLSDRYAYDDEGNIKPHYEKWETGLKEAAPVLAPGKSVSPPGNNKPNANLWTSTARRVGAAWTSQWATWLSHNQPANMSRVGYLYRVRPGALIMQLDYSQDAERIFEIFQDLGRVNSDQFVDYRDDMSIRRKFPWDQITRHFDAVNHGGYSPEGFTYGWDVESTAWFDTSFLQPLGEVPVVVGSDEDE